MGSDQRADQREEVRMVTLGRLLSLSPYLILLGSECELDVTVVEAVRRHLAHAASDRVNHV